MSDNYYAILGVANNASSADITRAYKNLILQHHPDKNLDNKEEAEKKFKQINNAYSILSNQEKRQKYDAYGHENLSDVEEKIDVNKLFSHVFNFTKRQKIVTDVHVTLDEIYNSAVKKFALGQRIIEIKLKPYFCEGKEIIEIYNNAEYHFIIREEKHEFYERVRHNLYVTIDITHKEACCGIKKTIRCIDGSYYDIDIDYISSSNYEHCILNKGMAYMRNGTVSYGNMYVKFNVLFNKLDIGMFTDEIKVDEIKVKPIKVKTVKKTANAVKETPNAVKETPKAVKETPKAVKPKKPKNK